MSDHASPGETSPEDQSSGADAFLIERSFDVSRDRMFDMWTMPDHFSKWLPPTGFDMTFIRAGIRPGGSTFYAMSGYGMTMYGRATYLEIRKPDRLVYTQQFVDEQENISRHPMAPTWPETMLTTVQLTQEGPDRTRVAIMCEAHGATTAVELATFIGAKAGMTGGWTGSFDKLEAYLSTL